jgi:phage-related protein
VTKVAVARPKTGRTALKRALAEPGRPLPSEARTKLEMRFAVDFSRIRIHTGPVADEATRSLDAEAVTFGHHILFRAGAWRPETPGGFDLLVHEAVHTLQHTGPLPDPAEARISQPGDPAEAGADTAAARGALPDPVAEAVVARRVAGIPPRTTQPADPARTVEEIGRTLLERVRADGQDRSGRVRNQLIRMDDNLRRDVLQWLERHMQPHEWHGFVELLAEPVPPGVEGTENRQAQAVAPAAPAEITAESEEAGAHAPTDDPATAQAAPAEGQPAPDEPQPSVAEAIGTPQEAAVGKPAIQNEAQDQTPAAEAGGAGGGPGPAAQGETGAVPKPEAPPAPSEAPAGAPSGEAQGTEATPATAPETVAETGVEGSGGSGQPAAPGAEEASTSEAQAPGASESATETPAAVEAAPAEEAGAAPEAQAPPESATETPAAAVEPAPAAEATTAPAAPAPSESATETSVAVVEPAPAEAATESATETSAAAVGPAPAEAATQSGAETQAAGTPPEAEGITAPEGPEETAAAPAGAQEVAEPGAETGRTPGQPGAPAPERSGTSGAVPPTLLGEFAGEPSENEAAPGGVEGGGGGGGGAPAPEAPPEQAAPLEAAASDPAGAVQSISTMRVGEAYRATGSARTAVSAQSDSQRNGLQSQPPSIQRPTGAPASTPGNVPVSPSVPDPAPAARADAGQPVPLPPAAAVPQAGAPVTQTVAPPRVNGTPDGQVSQADAQRVQEAVNNVPVTDEALNVDAGAAPSLPLEGDADPARAGEQQSALNDSAAATRQRGAQDAAAPMGEDHINPAVQPGTIQAQPGACSCCGGQGGEQQAAPGGAPDAGVAAVAEQERGDAVRQSALGAAGQLTQQQQQQATEQQQANTDSQQQVEQAIEDNARQQSAERTRARQQVQTSRQDWNREQQAAVDSAHEESGRAASGAQRDVNARQTQAQTDASGHITNGNQEIARTRTDSEQKARAERDRAKREADGGILSWLASTITSFFNRLRDAIHAVFDLARRAVRAAIETAQRLAHDVIDAARRAVVALVRAAGDLLIAIGNRLLAAFPALRERFRAAIQAVVEAAVAAVNALADLLERGINALLNALLAALMAIICAYETIYMAIVNTVANAVQGAIDFARSAIAAFGVFAELVKDIAANPGQWLRNLGSSILDGLRNHLWSALKTAVKNWFNETIEGIIGIGRLLLDLLRRGGLSLRKIAGFVWQAIISALPGIIIQFLIERLISLLIPAAAAILLVIQGLIAAWGAVQRIIQAFQLFFTFLKAVKGGNAGPQFAAALAASAVAIIQFLAMFLLARLGRAAGGVAGKLKALAQRLMAFFRRVARGVGRVLRRVGRVIMRGVRAVGRLARRDLQALRRVLRRTRIGRAILRGVARVRRAIGQLRRRFRRFRDRRRQNRERRRAERVERALRELGPRITSLARRGVRRLSLAVRLAFWRLRYRLRTLRIDHGTGRSSLHASASPEQSAPLTLQDLPASLLREIVRTAVDRVLLSGEIAQAEEALPADPTAPVTIRHPRDYLAYVRRYSDASRTPPLRFPQQREVTLADGSRTFETGPSRRSGAGRISLDRAATIRNQIVGRQGPYSDLVPELERIASTRGAPTRRTFRPVEDLVRRGRPASSQAVADTALLLFGRESIRNPANAAQAVLALDLIRAGRLQPGDLLTRLPQAPTKANPAAQRLESAEYRSIFLRDQDDPALAGRDPTAVREQGRELRTGRLLVAAEARADPQTGRAVYVPTTAEGAEQRSRILGSPEAHPSTVLTRGAEQRELAQPLLGPDREKEATRVRQRAQEYRASEADLTREWLALRGENWSFADQAEAREHLVPIVIERLVGFYRLRGVRARVLGR